MIISMSYRGTIKNGVVVVEAGVRLPEGQTVVVTTVPEISTEAADLPAFGIWSDRKDLGDPAEASFRLRRETERRGQ
jgi:hypothetical protein